MRPAAEGDRCQVEKIRKEILFLRFSVSSLRHEDNNALRHFFSLLPEEVILVAVFWIIETLL